jgi:hypothetical protein
MRSFSQASTAEDPETEAEIIVDAGPTGLSPMAAHAHADALSFTLTVRGRPLLVDPGTFIYQGDRPWRDWFKGTAAHNTVEVDGVDQAVSRGPTLWSRLPRVTVLLWSPREPTQLIAEHDGYARLPGRPIHRRSVTFDRRCRQIEIIDRVGSSASHSVAIHLHFARGVEVKPKPGNIWKVISGPVSVLVKLDNQCSVDFYEGSDEPIAGWLSPGFGQREAGPELIATRRVQPNDLLVTSIELLPTTEVDTTE